MSGRERERERNRLPPESDAAEADCGAAHHGLLTRCWQVRARPVDTCDVSRVSRERRQKPLLRLGSELGPQFAPQCGRRAGEALLRLVLHTQCRGHIGNRVP